MCHLALHWPYSQEGCAHVVTEGAVNNSRSSEPGRQDSLSQRFCPAKAPGLCLAGLIWVTCLVLNRPPWGARTHAWVCLDGRASVPLQKHAESVPSRALSAFLGKTRRKSSHFRARSAQAVLSPFACSLSGRLVFQSELFVVAFHEATRTPAAGPSPIRYRGPSQALARTLGFPPEEWARLFNPATVGEQPHDPKHVFPSHN